MLDTAAAKELGKRTELGCDWGHGVLQGRQDALNPLHTSIPDNVRGGRGERAQRSGGEDGDGETHCGFAWTEKGICRELIVFAGEENLRGAEEFTVGCSPFDMRLD